MVLTPFMGSDEVWGRLDPLLRGRWSPLTFDPAHEVATEDVELLLEAARWAPSAGNSQPWAFLTARRGDATHRRLVDRLAPSSARWAPAASLLVVNLCQRWVPDTDWPYSDFAHYDLGQAVAHMTIQAQAMGLAARQFRAFDADGIAAEFEVPRHWEVTTMTAFGRIPAGIEPHAALVPDQVGPPRTRRTDLTRPT
ncbi:nitroreductase family protein [Microlunatus sp. GCM10028923]